MTSEATGITNFLASMPGLAHAVVSRNLAREIIAACDGQMILAGRLYEIITESAGAGLLRITTRPWERRNPKARPLASALNRRNQAALVKENTP